jgi:hypothetical protein
LDGCCVAGTDSDAQARSNRDAPIGIELDLQVRKLPTYPLSDCPSNRGIRLGQREPSEKQWRAGQVAVTQFGRMCARLGIRIIAASSPQAKGRVEHN